MKIEDAIEFMKMKHKDQRRKQGTPYYLHPLTVSKILKEKGYGEEFQFVALFHDLLEDTNTTYNEIKLLTNQNIAEAVRLLTKEKNYNMEEYMGNIKNNELAKIVKVADRIQNLSEAHLASPEFREKYINETEMWFIDLAKNTNLENDLKDILEKLKKIRKKDEKIKNIDNEDFYLLFFDGTLMPNSPKFLKITIFNDIFYMETENKYNSYENDFIIKEVKEMIYSYMEKLNDISKLQGPSSRGGFKRYFMIKIKEKKYFLCRNECNDNGKILFDEFKKDLYEILNIKYN